MKSMLHDCETYGWTLRPIMRKGQVIKVVVQSSDLKIEFRDSMKKSPTSLKELAQSVGMTK